MAISGTQATMRADEAQYRLLFEASPLATWIIDEATGRFLVVNDAAVRQYGYSRAEFRAMTVEAIRLPHEAGRMKDEFRAQANLPFVLAGAWHHRRKDGSVFAVEVRAARVTFDGAPSLLTFVLEAEREQAVAALRLREQQLAEAQEIAHIGSFQWDAISGVATWSRELYRIYGMRPDTPASLHEFLARVHTGDRARVKQTLDDAAARRERRFEFECRFVLPDGAERTLLARHVATYDDSGRQLTFAGTVQDVTDQARAQRTLVESERLHRELMEYASDIVTVLDPDGRVLYMSPSIERLLGHSPRGLEGQDVLQFIHPDDAPRVAAAIAQDVATPGVPSAVEFRFRHRDGTWRVLESIGQGNTGRNASMRIVVNSRDVTDRREAERMQRVLMDRLAVAQQAAEAAAIAKSAFLATMSHEIRTPMNAVLGLTELVLATALAPEQRRHLQMVRDAGDVLLTLLNDILDLSKIEAGQLELEAIPFDLAALVQAAVGLLSNGAREHGLSLQVELAPTLPAAVLGDPMRLRQVLTNLVGNAIKFTAEGSVVVSVVPAPATGTTVSVRFAVRDTGVGIPADKLDKVFQDFSQADGTTTRKYGGTGLGLSIARRLVRRMGGDLTVTSVLAQGSEFAFTVPFPVADAAALPTPDRPDAPPVSLTAPAPARLAHEPPVAMPGSTGHAVRLAGVRALVVDAAASDRRLVREILAPLGAAVTEASSAESALRALDRAQEEQMPFAVILLDPHLTDDAGFGLADSIRSRPELGTTRLLMLTSAERQRDVIDRLPPGTAGFLLKPVSRSRLIEATAALVRTGPAPEIAAGDARAPLRILIAEDNPVNQEVASAMLRMRGHDVEIVGNGGEAVTRALAGRFDVVLMDIHMPVLDGVDATKAIRLSAGGGLLPIIAVTADASPSEREHALAAGMDEYLTKPFTAKALVALVEGTVALRRAAAAHEVEREVGTPPADIETFRATMREAGAEAAVDGILDTFLADAPARSARLGTAIEAGDGEAIRAEAHAYRSAAASIGAHALAAHLLATELAGRDRRIADARALASSVRDDSAAVLHYVRGLRRVEGTS